MDWISNLTGVGVSGLAVWLCFRFADNIVEKNTNAIIKLSVAIDKLENTILTFYGHQTK